MVKRLFLRSFGFAWQPAAGPAFHTTAIAFKRWRPDEFEALTAAHAALGASWDQIVNRLPGRTASECRKRWHRLHVDRQLQSSTQLRFYYDGWEVAATEGGGKLQLVEVPLEAVGSRTYLHRIIAESCPFYLSRSEHRLAGWHPAEDMAIRQAYDTFGPDWAAVAACLRHRTPSQCRNRLLLLHRSQAVNQLEAAAAAEQHPSHK